MEPVIDQANETVSNFSPRYALTRRGQAIVERYCASGSYQLSRKRANAVWGVFGQKSDLMYLSTKGDHIRSLTRFNHRADIALAIDSVKIACTANTVITSPDFTSCDIHH